MRESVLERCAWCDVLAASAFDGAVFRDDASWYGARFDDEHEARVLVLHAALDDARAWSCSAARRAFARGL